VHNGGPDVNDIKKAARDTEADVKEAWRKSDGDESLGDKAANVTDRASNAVKDAADDVHEGADKLSRDVAYEEGRADEAAIRTPR
jgi:hypothetical protein